MDFHLPRSSPARSNTSNAAPARETDRFCANSRLSAGPAEGILGLRT